MTKIFSSFCFSNHSGENKKEISLPPSRSAVSQSCEVGMGRMRGAQRGRKKTLGALGTSFASTKLLQSFRQKLGALISPREDLQKDGERETKNGELRKLNFESAPKIRARRKSICQLRTRKASSSSLFFFRKTVQPFLFYTKRNGQFIYCPAAGKN